MTTLRAAFAALALAVAPAAAEPVTPQAFRDYAEGWTLYFERDGEPWGAESFEPGGAVTWRFREGGCLAGVWRPYEGDVCFYYGQGEDVLCWSLRREDGRIVGTLETGADAGLELDIVRRDRVPLSCGQGLGT